MFHRIKGVIGIFLIFLSIGGIIYWENNGREKLMYKEAVIAKEDIFENDLITKDKIMMARIEGKNISDYTVVEVSEILGKESKQFIPCQMPIDKRYLNNPDLVLEANEYVLRLPNEWIIAFPGTLRRGDRALFYPVKKEEVVSEDPEKIPSVKRSFEVVIAYVKDSANREVVSVGSEKLQRLDGSSNINAIEVVSTVQMTEKLKSCIDDNYKFIILYH